MPKHSAAIVRLSLIYLCVGATLGGMMLVDKGLAIWTFPWQLRPLHEEFMLFGWMVQLAFGVASWILPKPPKKQAAWPLIGACGLLNAGVWAVGLARFVGAAPLTAAGRIAEIAALIVFATQMWPRVRSFGRRD